MSVSPLKLCGIYSPLDEEFTKTSNLDPSAANRIQTNAELLTKEQFSQNPKLASEVVMTTILSAQEILMALRRNQTLDKAGKQIPLLSLCPELVHTCESLRKIHGIIADCFSRFGKRRFTLYQKPFSTLSDLIKRLEAHTLYYFELATEQKPRSEMENLLDESSFIREALDLKEDWSFVEVEASYNTTRLVQQAKSTLEMLLREDVKDCESVIIKLAQLIKKCATYKENLEKYFPSLKLTEKYSAFIAEGSSTRLCETDLTACLRELRLHYYCKLFFAEQSYGKKKPRPIPGFFDNPAENV